MAAKTRPDAFPLAAGGIRLVTGKVTDDGVYRYRNQYGHSVEADFLSDYMERIGFFGAHASRIIRYATGQLRPGDWAIDVGANVGLIASPVMAAAVGPTGCVWPSSPCPATSPGYRS